MTGETRLLAVLLLIALPVLGWPLRHSLNSQTLQAWLIVGAFAFAGAALVIGLIVLGSRCVAWLKRALR